MKRYVYKVVVKARETQELKRATIKRITKEFLADGVKLDTYVSLDWLSDYPPESTIVWVPGSWGIPIPEVLRPYTVVATRDECYKYLFPHEVYEERAARLAAAAKHAIESLLVDTPDRIEALKDLKRTEQALIQELHRQSKLWN